MSAFNEQDHPRQSDGRFRDKPQQSAGIGLAAGTPRQRSIADPDLQGLQWVLPHIDGAVIEYEGGERAPLEMRPWFWGVRPHVMNPETGEPVSVDPVGPYRIVSIPDDADPEFVQAELENLVRVERFVAAKSDFETARDDLGVFFDKRDMGAWEDMTVTKEGVIEIPYKNRSNQREGTIRYSREDGLTFAEGSISWSGRARRLWDDLNRPDFIQQADRALDKQQVMLERDKERTTHQEAIGSMRYERYGHLDYGI